MNEDRYTEPTAEDFAEASAERRQLDGQPRYPELEVVVELAGPSGNAFAVLGNVQKALRENGHASEINAFMAAATSGDYDHLLATAGRYVTVVKV